MSQTIQRIEFLDSSDHDLLEDITRTVRTGVEFSTSTTLYYFTVKSTIHIGTDKDKITRIFTCCALMDDYGVDSVPEFLTLTQGADFEVVNESLMMHTHSTRNISMRNVLEFVNDIKDSAKLIYRNFKDALDADWNNCLWFECSEPMYRYSNYTGCTKKDLNENLVAVRKAWVRYSVQVPDPLKTLRILDLEGKSFTSKVREPHQDRIVEALSKAYHDEVEFDLKYDFRKYLYIV